MNNEPIIVKKFDQKSSLNIQWTISQCTLYFVPQMPATCECGCQGRVAKEGMLKPDHNDRDGVTPDMRRRDAAVRKKWNAQKRRVYANVDGEFDGQAGTHECMAERYLDKKMRLNVSTQNGLTSGDIAVSVTSTQIGLLETIASLKPGQTILLHACPSEVADSIKALGLCGLSNWPTGSLWMLKVMSSLHFARASRLIFSQTRSSSASRTKQPTLACSGLFRLGLISWPPKGKSAGKIVCF